MGSPQFLTREGNTKAAGFGFLEPGLNQRLEPVLSEEQDGRQATHWQLSALVFPASIHTQRRVRCYLDMNHSVLSPSWSISPIPATFRSTQHTHACLFTLSKVLIVSQLSGSQACLGSRMIWKMILILVLKALFI